ncbi:MAG: hypothetical protein IJD78_07915 [Clostridia bacterium]|nr:hypothetical protein [Clostridia bacterium]MBQ3007470.1 hypothetical protein [Clostridia bacterium]
MNKRNLFVRIVAILLCVIMILGVGTAALYAFAAEPVAAAAPATGSQPMLWVVIAVVAAIAVIAGCLVIPKIKK